jgi:hypothetical protein
MSTPFFPAGIDTFDQPLVDAWWTPGWTSQNQAYIPAPGSPFNSSPPQVTYVNVTYRYFDMDNSPLGGFLTFMPSDSSVLTISGTSWRLPQRLTGIPLPIIFGPGGPGQATNQFGSGKVYIQGGLLAVALMPTDLAGLVTDGGAPLTYTVIEHMPSGRKFTITVPSASADPVDLGTLIVPDTTVPYGYDPMFPLSDEGVSAAPYQPTPAPPPSFSQPFTAQTSVTVHHNLGVYPEVLILDPSDNEVTANVQYPNVNTVIVTFGSAFTGTVICNA